MKRRTHLFVVDILVVLTAFGAGFRDAGAVSLQAERNAELSPLGQVLPVEVTVFPEIPEYSVEPDLSNVAGVDSLAQLSDEHRRLLAENGFCILPSPSFDIYSTYGANPSPFVTSDSVLHAYMVLLTDTLKSLEEAYLVDELKRYVDRAMHMAESLDKHCPESMDPAVNRAVTVFAVANRLFNPLADVPETVKEDVEAEVARVEEARFIGKLAGDERPRDYTVYEPTAGYAANETLARYYRARKYLTINTHPFDTAEDVQACVLVSMAAQSTGSYHNLVRLDRFLVGESEDPTPFDVLAKTFEFFDGSFHPRDLADPEVALRLGEYLKETLPKPEIADQPQEEPGADAKLGRGMRIFSPGVTMRAVAFQEIGEHGMVPGGKHMASVLGNSAVEVTTAEEDLLTPARELLETAKAADPAGLSVHTTTLAALSELSREWPEGYPQFMRGPAWQMKTANTQLAGWAELEHATYLYAKDNAMYMGSVLRGDEFHGYVEPVPEFYAALLSLTHRTRTAFEELGVFENLRKLKRPVPPTAAARGANIVATAKHYETLEDVLDHLIVMSQKELENRPFNEEEIAFLHDYGETLKYLCFNESNSSSAHEPMGVVVRIVREYLTKRGVHVGTGRPLQIYVIVPWMGELHWTLGAVYSYYEFTRPLDEPLTDAAWKKELESAYQAHREKPWLQGKGLGVDPVTWSEAQFRAWLPEEEPEDRFGNSYNGTHPSMMIQRSWVRPFLDRVAFVSLSPKALSAAAAEFSQGRHSGEHARTALYLWLRNAEPEARKECGIAALETMMPGLREKPSIAHSTDYRCWLYYSFMLLGDQVEDPDVVTAVADLVPYLTDEMAMEQLLEDETVRTLIEAGRRERERRADAGGGKESKE